MKSVSRGICDYRVRRGWNTGGICRASRSHSGVILHHKQNLTTRSHCTTDARQHPHPGPGRSLGELALCSPAPQEPRQPAGTLGGPAGPRAGQVQPALPCLRASARFTARPCLVSSPLPPAPEVWPLFVCFFSFPFSDVTDFLAVAPHVLPLIQTSATCQPEPEIPCATSCARSSLYSF